MNIALIGCGKQAPKHISGLLASDLVEKVFVADQFTEAADRLAANYKGNVVATTVADVFTNDDIKAVVIATPTFTHFDLCKQALNSGKPFLVEKPLSSSYEEAVELAKLSKSTGVPGMVGFIYRFAPIFDAINTLVKSDEDVLGTSQHAVFRIAGRGSDQPWKHQQSKEGGAISEMMVHMIDLAVWYFGRAAEIRLNEDAIVRPVRDIRGESVNCDAEDWAVANLVMENGTRVLLQADMNSPVFRQFIEIDGLNGLVEGSIQNTFQDALTLFEPRGDYVKGRQPLEVTPGNFYIKQHECFLDMVKSGSDPERCSLDDAVEVMRIQIALKSQKTA
jgi:predicted dehydrogenase